MFRITVFPDAFLLEPEVIPSCFPREALVNTSESQGKCVVTIR
jgi:hypothetical protein